MIYQIDVLSDAVRVKEVWIIEIKNGPYRKTSYEPPSKTKQEDFNAK